MGEQYREDMIMPLEETVETLDGVDDQCCARYSKWPYNPRKGPY